VFTLNLPSLLLLASYLRGFKIDTAFIFPVFAFVGGI